MKTTSYKISKKLAEIGFESDAVYYYRKDEPLENQIWHLTELQFEGIDNHYPAYDLETILATLPYSINQDNCDYFFTLNHYVIAYIDSCHEKDDLFGIVKNDNESLADTAARLLILLHEKGIVKFNN